ncbi:MAG: hypothetical protein RLZ44_1811 [Pseudomonadota bacterium]|jgi:phospholipid N-methyltransferase
MERLDFFKEFVRHPLQIGSVIPSSRFLERRIVTAAAAASAKVVVELGPGTGGTTRALLRAMRPDAALLSIEINPHFHAALGRIRDPRLIAHLGSASELRQIVSGHGLEAPNAIVSGIPFSTMPRVVALQTLEAVAAVLAPNGHFVAYQVSRRVRMLCEPLLGPGTEVMELRNVPPMYVFVWDKRNDATSF